MKTVMCFGTFDILHLGHLNYFEQAQKYGDYLIVVIARDKTKLDQHKSLVHAEQERLQQVKNIPLVNEAVLGNIGDHLKIIRDKKPEVICLGYDHPLSEEQLSQKLKEMGITPKIVRLKPFHPEKYKSSLFRPQKF